MPVGGHTIEAATRRVETPRAAGVAGLAFSVLMVASLLLMRRHPDPGSSAEVVAEWYLGKNAGRTAAVGLYVAPFAGIAFLWFIAVLRAHVSALEDRFFDTALLGSGLLFVAMLFASAATAGSLFAGVKFLDAPVPDPNAVDVVRSLAYTLFYVYALRAAAVFVVVASTIGRKTGALPRWLVVAGYVVAVVLLLTVSFHPLVSLLFPAWVATVSIVILKGRLRERPATT